MGHVIVIDSSFRGAFMGVGKLSGAGVELVYESIYQQQAGSSRYLPAHFAMIQDIWGEESFEGLLVANGPGSFTGIKIGLAFAAGIRMGTNRPLEIRVTSSLAAISRKMPQCVWLMPSTRSKGFIASRGRVGLLDIGPSFLDDIGQFLSSGQAVQLVGEWPEAGEALQSSRKQYTHMEIKRFGSLSLESLASSYYEQPIVSSEALIKANYLRKSTAEERLDGVSL